MNNPKRIAILDLGTNMFHLMICEVRPTAQNVIIFKKKQEVRLASGGINYIEKAAWKRAINTLSHYQSIIKSYEVQEIYAFGTAGLRTANNGEAFIQVVKNDIGISISLIDGDKEAELIWKGVRQSVNLGTHKVLIMDIGGGSVEFIIADNTQIYWKKSFPIGVAVLKNAFHKKDPLGFEGVLLLRQFFDAELYPLRTVLKEHQCEILIGASGAFSSIIDMEFAAMNTNRKIENNKVNVIDIHYFNELLQRLIKMPLSKRLEIPGLTTQKGEMIVVACLLIDYVFKEFDLSHIIQSEFALKQGVLWEVLYGNKIKRELES